MWKKGGIKRKKIGVEIFVGDIICFDSIGQPLKTPVRDKINIFRNPLSRRNIKTEVVVGCQKHVRAAEFARKNTIRFVENYRRSALRTLLFYLKVRAVHRTYYNRWIPVNFQSRTWRMP